MIKRYSFFIFPISITTLILYILYYNELYFILKTIFIFKIFFKIMTLNIIWNKYSILKKNLLRNINIKRKYLYIRKFIKNIWYEKKISIYFLALLSCILAYISEIISVSNILFYILRYILFIIPLLISIAYITLIERKLLGYIQLRKGPNKIGIYGLLQPISDGIKLFTNEMIIPSHSISYLFIIIPILNLTLSLYINSYIIKFGIINEYSLFIILFIVMLISFNILVAGWVSNSKYSLLGSLRACAQIISYEISFTLLLFIFILITNSFNIYSFSTYSSHTGWLIFPFFIPFLLMYISILAENNRTPFDLAEAESELVSGYNVEYSSFSFAFFFLSEYLIIIFFSMFLVIIFLGNNYFIFKTLTILIISLIIRGTLPRYRYDQLMMLCWKYILPVTITFFIISLFIIQNIY